MYEEGHRVAPRGTQRIKTAVPPVTKTQEMQGATTQEHAELADLDESMPGHLRIVGNPTPWQHVAVWLVGAVLASLVPFLFLYFHGVDRNKPPNMFELLGRGDLLLISLVLTIGGITELVLVLNKIHQKQIM